MVLGGSGLSQSQIEQCYEFDDYEELFDNFRTIAKNKNLAYILNDLTFVKAVLHDRPSHFFMLPAKLKENLELVEILIDSYSVSRLLELFGEFFYKSTIRDKIFELILQKFEKKEWNLTDHQLYNLYKSFKYNDWTIPEEYFSRKDYVLRMLKITNIMSKVDKTIIDDEIVRTAFSYHSGYSVLHTLPDDIQKEFYNCSTLEETFNMTYSKMSHRRKLLKCLL